MSERASERATSPPSSFPLCLTAAFNPAALSPFPAASAGSFVALIEIKLGARACLPSITVPLPARLAGLGSEKPAGERARLIETSIPRAGSP